MLFAAIRISLDFKYIFSRFLQVSCQKAIHFYEAESVRIKLDILVLNVPERCKISAKCSLISERSLYNLLGTGTIEFWSEKS